jgi:hypothetical protein
MPVRISASRSLPVSLGPGPLRNAAPTRARRFLHCIPSQVCFEPLTRTRTVTSCKYPALCCGSIKLRKLSR